MNFSQEFVRDILELAEDANKVLVEYLNQCRGEKHHPVYRNVFTSSAAIHYLESIWLDLMCRAINQVLGSRPLTLMGKFDRK